VRILVTGAAGFVGSHLVEMLVEDDHEVIGVDSFTEYYSASRKRANLAGIPEGSSFTLVEEDLNELDVDRLVDGVGVIYHLAGQPGVRASWGTEFEIYLAQNVLSTQKLLEAAKSASIEKFVLASSSSVYGQAERFPTSESDRPRPVSPYGVTKLAAEHLCHLYHQAFGVPAVMLRYFTIFGPRQRPDMAFTRFIAAAIREQPLTVIGDGMQSRDFTYVADAVAATIAAGETGVAGRVYNIAGGCQATVLDVVAMLEQIFGRPLERESLQPVPGDPRKTGADTTAAQEDLGYQPSTGLEDGLGRQVAAMRAIAVDEA
jgi:UDP-glucuronate 4-epimerase